MMYILMWNNGEEYREDYYERLIAAFSTPERAESFSSILESKIDEYRKLNRKYMDACEVGEDCESICAQIDALCAKLGDFQCILDDRGGLTIEEIAGDPVGIEGILN